jgi:hypothetical protein
MTAPGLVTWECTTCGRRYVWGDGSPSCGHAAYRNVTLNPYPLPRSRLVGGFEWMHGVGFGHLGEADE